MHKAIYGPSGNVIGALQPGAKMGVLYINPRDRAEFNQQQMDMLREHITAGMCEIQATPEGWDDNARTWPVFCGALRMAPEAVY